MDEDDFGVDAGESLVVGRYDAGSPFGQSVVELRRCGQCAGLYKEEITQFVMGMYIAPLGEEAFKRQEQADEHNRKLDDIFKVSEKCRCNGNDIFPKWLKRF